MGKYRKGSMRNYDFETQEHSTLGDKMLQHCEVLNDIQNNKKWRPITFQLVPTAVCDFNCHFCSVKNRDKTVSMPFEWIEKGLRDFRELGAKAVEITGGGNPLLYTQINEIISLASELGYDIGIISNSINPGKHLTPESASKLKWYRASLSAWENLREDYIDIVNSYDFSVIPEGKLSFSYIINSETTEERLRKIAEVVKQRPDAKFVRIAPNCLEKETLETFKDKWQPIIEKIDPDNKFFMKEISQHYTPYPDYCAVGMIRPYVCEDGNIYACSSFLLRNRKLEPEWIIGHITDVKGFYEKANKLFEEKGVPYEVPIDKCFHCLLYNNNKFLHTVIREMEDKNFA